MVLMFSFSLAFRSAWPSQIVLFWPLSSKSTFHPLICYLLVFFFPLMHFTIWMVVHVTPLESSSIFDRLTWHQQPWSDQSHGNFSSLFVTFFFLLIEGKQSGCIVAEWQEEESHWHCFAFQNKGLLPKCHITIQNPTIISTASFQRYSVSVFFPQVKYVLLFMTLQSLPLTWLVCSNQKNIFTMSLFSWKIHILLSWS